MPISDKDNGPQKPLIINGPYDYLNYAAQQGRMTPNQAAAVWNEHNGRKAVNGDNNTRLKAGGKFDLQEYIYQQETGNAHSPGYFEGKAALWKQNADYYIDKYGEKEYNRYSDYYTLMAAQGKSGLNQAYTPYLSALGDMIENRAAYESKYGKAGYDYLYNKYRNEAQGDRDKINEVIKWGQGGRYSADIMEAYPWLKDQYVYDSNDTIDMMALYLGYMPSAFNQEAARVYVDEANKIKRSQASSDTNAAQDTGLTPLEDIVSGNRPVTQQEVQEALEIITQAHAKAEKQKAKEEAQIAFAQDPHGYITGKVREYKEKAEQTYDQNKAIIIEAQKYGLVDAEIDPETLSPEEALVTAETAIADANMTTPYEWTQRLLMAVKIKQAAEAQENYRKMGIPYPGAPSLGPFDTSRIMPEDIGELEAKIASTEEEYKKLQADMAAAGIEMEKVRPEEGTTTPEFEEAVAKFEELRDKTNDTEAWLKEMKSEKPIVEKYTKAMKAGEEAAKNSDFLDTVNRVDKEIKEYLPNDGGIWAGGKQKNFLRYLETPTDKTIYYGTLGGYTDLVDRDYVGLAAGEQEYGRYTFLTDEERDTLKYFYGKGMTAEFDAYLKDIEWMLDKRYVLNESKVREENFEKMGVGGKILAGATSFLSMPFSGRSLTYGIGQAITGEPANKYASAHQYARTTSELRNIVTEGMSPLGRILTNAGFSTGDMIITLGTGPTASLIIMSSEAGGQATYQAYQNGATPLEAVGVGLATAITEYVTEKLPIDNMFKMKGSLKAAYKTAKAAGKTTAQAAMSAIGTVFGNGVKQGLMEAPQEVIAQFSENIEEWIIMGDKSQIEQYIRQLIADGMSPVDARRTALTKYLIEDPVESAASGFVSGFGSGGFASAVGGSQSTQNTSPQAPAVQGEIQSQNVPVMPNTDVNIPGTYTPYMHDGKVQSQIQNNIQTNPEGMCSALTEGMTALEKIETRIKADGENMGQPGFNFDASRNAYTDFALGRGSIEATAAAIAGDIRNAVGSGKLATREMIRLGNILTHIIGDNNVAGAYLRPAVAAAAAGRGGGGPASKSIGLDGQGKSGYNVGQIAGDSSYSNYLRMLDEVDAENRAGMTARNFAGSKGVQSTLTDAEAQTKQADAQRNMTKAVSMLTNLPAEVQTQADAGAARQALYDYMKADEGGKAAAYDKAAEQLKQSISAALEAKGLDKWTRQRLKRALDNIDSKGEMGDNKIQNIFVGKLKGENVRIENIQVKEIKYVKRDRETLQILRNEFENSIKQKFLKELANNTEKLKRAGFSDNDIRKMKDGGVPVGWQVHHKLPLDDGGTNSLDNFVLIKNDPYHKVITNYQNRFIRSLNIGEIIKINWPMPEGNIYPNKSK